MVDFDSFFSEEMLLAPPHPLAENLELPMMDAARASFEEIQKNQQPLSNPVSTPDIERVQVESSGKQPTTEPCLPGIVKRIIPLDNDTFWEYWWCVPDRLLLPEDQELMMSDLPRVESILEKLLWLFGGYCFGEDSHRQGDLMPVRDWQEVLKFARQHGFESYLLDIDFLPTAIKRYNPGSDPVEDVIDAHIAVEPPHWHIEFFQLTSNQGRLQIKQPKTICSCQIWMGKPFIKNLRTSETITRYDLWVSRPLDLTQPPWYR